MPGNQRFEQLNEIQIAEIREIFTLFDKNSDGYVNTNELGNILRALNMNPTQAEVKEMERDVDPNDTGSFDQMNLISLIARRPKPVETLEQMIEAIKVLNSEAGDEKDKVKLSIEQLKYSMMQFGEKMQEHEIEEILQDCADMIHDDSIIIDDFANYLMSR